jgi:hypothetical protein
MRSVKAWPFVGAVLWLLLKFSSTVWLNWEDSAMAGTFVHLGLLLAISVGVVTLRKSFVTSRDTSFLDAMIEVAKPTLTYALFATLAVGTWYFGIHEAGTQARKAEQAQQIEEALGTDEAFAATLEQRPDLTELDRERLYEKQMENLDIFYSPAFHLGFALLGLVMMGLLFSLVVTLLWRSVWR